MKTEQEINLMISEDYQKLMGMLYPERLPNWLLDNFENIMFNTPQDKYNYFARTIQAMLLHGGDVSKLTVYQAGFLLKLWTHLEPRVLCSDLYAFLDKKAQIEPHVAEYDRFMKREEARLNKKKDIALKAIGRKMIVAP